MDATGITINVLESADDATVAAFARLIPQLSTNAAAPDRERVALVLDHPANTVYAARTHDDLIRGLVTLVRVELATGSEARIEDVVVDQQVRGFGIGRALVVAALTDAAAHGARYVDLTSGPQRVAARALYVGLGFTVRETGVFRHELAEYRR